MELEITSETERALQEELRKGAFQSMDELILAVSAFEGSDQPCEFESGSLVVAFLVVTERSASTGRSSTLLNSPPADRV